MNHLSLNLSYDLLFIGLLIYPHLILQKVHDFRQTDAFARYVFMTAAYTSSFVRYFPGTLGFQLRTSKHSA